jgi:hypothetical protein
MRRRRHSINACILGCLLLGAAANPSSAQSPNPIVLSAADQAAKEDYAYSIATQAYVFTFPLTMTERERKLRMRDRPRNPLVPVAPINQIGHMRQLANAKAPLPYSPNYDTLYSGILLELADGPIVLHVPDVFDRYISIQATDAYTSNLPYELGTRVSGGKGGDILFAGPGWKGVVPEGMRLTRVPSNTSLVAVRIRIDGESDLPAVMAIQDKMSLTALADWDGGRGMGTKPAPIPKLMARPDYTGEFAYFRTVADLLTENPPGPEHAAALKMFEFIGLRPGMAFDPARLDEPTRRGILRAEKGGFEIIRWSTHERGFRLPTHWNTQLTGGTYGFDYLGRAEDSFSGLIQHDLEEAMYFIAYTDSKGEPLVGGRRYTLHFQPGYLPATMPNGFWSLTLYDGDRFRYIDNPLNRYSLGGRPHELKFNADGSLDIHVQPESPGADRESNWLPAPRSGPLRLNIRCYLPTPEMLKVDQMWKHIPPIVATGEPVVGPAK